MKQIQIPEELFVALVKYHILEIPVVEPEIKSGLTQKLDALINRQLYTTYKTAPTEEEKEKARKEYLERKGVPESFRW